MKTKLPPVHPGEILLHDFLEPLGLSQSALAEALGVTPMRVSQIVRGHRAITAGDIAWPFEITCVNPDEVIAHVEEDEGALDIEVTVERGRGYRSAEAAEGLAIGEIPVDAIFTPIAPATS